MNTLKPCPFCPDGGDVQLVTFTGGADDVIYYRACGTILKHKIWNTRPIEDELQKRIAELEADNAEFRQLIRDWSIVLDQNNGFQLWHVESVRQAMLEINKECEK